MSDELTEAEEAEVDDLICAIRRQCGQVVAEYLLLSGPVSEEPVPPAAWAPTKRRRPKARH